MKKIIAVVLVLLSVGSITAQDGSSVSVRKHRFGVKIAPGISYLNIDKQGQESDGADYTFGYGLQYEYAFSENFSFATGILMNSFRGNVKYTDSLYFVFDKNVSGVDMKDTASQIFGRKYTFKSVDIPIVLKLKTPEIGYLTYFAEFGTTLSVIYDSYSSKNEVVMNEGDAQTQLSDDLAELDASEDVRLFKGALNIGIGAEYNLVGNTSLLVGLNWNSSFSNILSKTSDEIYYGSTNEKFSQIVKSDYVSLTVGIQF